MLVLGKSLLDTKKWNKREPQVYQSAHFEMLGHMFFSCGEVADS